MKAKFLIIILAVASLTVCSCREVHPDLQRAEAIMESAPDSALALLEAINGSELNGEARALHALLLTQALDKNYIDVTDDSLIKIAARYYLPSDDEYHKMLTYIYRAGIECRTGYLESSMIDALKAHDIADARSDVKNMSRIESLIAVLYANSYNVRESLQWELRALEHAKQAKNSQWIYNGYAFLSETMLAMFDFKNALLYADSASMISSVYDQGVWEVKYTANYGLENYKAADSIFRLMRTYEEFDPSPQLIDAQSTLDRSVLSMVPDNTEDDGIGEKVSFMYIKLRAYYDNKEYDKAYDVIQEIGTLHNDLILDLSQTSLMHTESSHYTNKAITQMIQIKHQRQTLLWIAIACGLAVILLVFVIYGIKFRAKTARVQLENDFLMLNQEYHRIKLLKVEEERRSNDLSSEVDSLTAELNYLSKQSSLAFVKHFSWIDKLGNMLIDADISPERKEKILYKRVSDEIKATGRISIAKEIEQEIKDNSPAVSAQIDALGLIPSEKEVVLYVFAGFSVRVISMLTKKSARSIYNLRARIKSKLQKIDNDMSVFLLTLF